MGKTDKNVVRGQKELSVETMPLDELRRRSSHAMVLIAQVKELLPGMNALTDEERKNSNGRIRNGEDKALNAVLDVADARPELFSSLADKDGGDDPNRFETQLLRDRFDRRAVLAKLQPELEGLTNAVSDTVLDLGTKAREPTQAAYQIAKVVANSDAKVRAKLAPALDFYAAIGRKGAATRANKPKPG